MNLEELTQQEEEKDLSREFGLNMGKIRSLSMEKTAKNTLKEKFIVQFLKNLFSRQIIWKS